MRHRQGERALLSEVKRAAEMLGGTHPRDAKEAPSHAGHLPETNGIPQSHMNSIERGAMLPNLVTLFRLAAALNCKVSALVSVFDKENPATLVSK